MTKIYIGRSRGWEYKNLRYLPSAADCEASRCRAITTARTRSRWNAGRWKIRNDKREARCRVETGEKSQKERRHADARSRREHWIKASVTVRRVHLSRVYETVNQNGTTWEDARDGIRKLLLTLEPLYDPHSVFDRDKFHQIIGANTHRKWLRLENSREDKSTISGALSYRSGCRVEIHKSCRTGDFVEIAWRFKAIANDPESPRARFSIKKWLRWIECDGPGPEFTWEENRIEVTRTVMLMRMAAANAAK